MSFLLLLLFFLAWEWERGEGCCFGTGGDAFGIACLGIEGGGFAMHTPPLQCMDVLLPSYCLFSR